MASERIRTILTSVDGKVRTLLKPDRFYVALYDPVRDQLEFPWVREDGELVEWDARLRQDDRLPDRVIGQQDILLLEGDFSAQAAEAGVGYWPSASSPGSWLGVPMVFEGQVLGVLVAEHRDSGAFGERGVRMLSTIARQTAPAIENARLYERLNRRIADLDAVNEIGQRLTSSIQLEEEEILNLVHQQASELMDTDNMYIALYDQDTDTVRFGLAFVDGEEVDTDEAEGWQPRKGGAGRTEWIIHNREPLLIRTLSESKDWYDRDDRREVEEERREYIGKPFASWVGVPMMVGEKVYGVIATYHETEEYVYDEDDVQILSSMASQAAIALDNVRLYNNLESLVEERTRELQQRTHQLEQANTELEQANEELREAKEDLEQAQRAKIAAERLVEANRWGMEFAHHLNNIAGTIPTRASKIHDLLDPYDSRQAQALDDLEWIRSDALRLLELANVMRQGFPADVEPESIDINEVLQEAWEDVARSMAPETRSRISLNMDLEDALPTVIAVRKSVRQALFNILQNAVDAVTPEGGTVGVEVLHRVEPRSELHISISDNGTGIPEEDVGRIFNPLFTRKDTGLGMGLWLAKHTIERLGGEIEVESELEEGSTFLIRVPVGGTNGREDKSSSR